MTLEVTKRSGEWSESEAPRSAEQINGNELPFSKENNAQSATRRLAYRTHQREYIKYNIENKRFYCGVCNTNSTTPSTSRRHYNTQKHRINDILHKNNISLDILQRD